MIIIILYMYFIQSFLKKLWTCTVYKQYTWVTQFTFFLFFYHPFSCQWNHKLHLPLRHPSRKDNWKINFHHILQTVGDGGHNQILVLKSWFTYLRPSRPKKLLTVRPKWHPGEPPTSLQTYQQWTGAIKEFYGFWDRFYHLWLPK